MRMPEAKIRGAILHPDKLVRQEALLYFGGCYSRDAEVLPLAIQAIEKYGRKDAFLYLHPITNLAQAEATVDWAIKELHRNVDTAHDADSFFPVLSKLLCIADPQVLEARAGEVLQAPGFLSSLQESFQGRLRLASWDVDQCWKELERVCAECADVDLDYGVQLVQMLARSGDRCSDRVLEFLAKDVDGFGEDPMAWMEIFLVKLAGELRLERAIPLIVKKLYEDEEVLSEECVQALSKIGTDAAAEAVTEGWREAAWEYRLYAGGALENIHSDTTVRKCLELLPHDRELDIRTQLAVALLSQYDEAGIEPVRRMVQRRAFDPMHCDLSDKLVAVSTILGVTFPELPIWKREAEEKLADQGLRRGEFERLLIPSPPKAVPPWDDPLDPKPAPFLREEKQVGRNGPCPCGSGKKFKKCCLGRRKW